MNEYRIDTQAANYHRFLIDKYENNFPGISDISQIFKADNQFLFFYNIKNCRILLLSGDANSIFGIKARDIALEDFLNEIHENDREKFIAKALDIYKKMTSKKKECKEITYNFRKKGGKHLSLTLKNCNIFRDEKNEISRLLILANVSATKVKQWFIG